MVGLAGYTAYAIHQTIQSPAFQKGMCFVTWSKDKFESTLSDQALAMLKELGVEYVQVNVTQYQEKYNSTKIQATELTPSDSSVRHAISKAHDLGLKVMLKPHIDLIDKEDGTYWRADIGFTNEEDWQSWFANYEKMITHYAHMAEKMKVEIFCVGTELAFTSQRTECWKNVINSVRENFSGKLIYAANWDEYKNVKFWSDLDYAGIDAYFPLTYKKNPSLQDLKEGWKKWVGEIESWQSETQKPVVFTEIGYASTPNAAYEPWKAGEAGNADVEMQANCYRAFFDAVYNKPWLAGVYWWESGPTVYGGGVNNRNYTILNKPAAKILAEQYGTTKLDSDNDSKIEKELSGRAGIMEQKIGERTSGTGPMAEEKSMGRPTPDKQ